MVFLLTRCLAFTEDFKTLSDPLSKLNMFAVKTRYPYAGQIDLDMVEKALSSAQDAIIVIGKYLDV